MRTKLAVAALAFLTLDVGLSTSAHAALVAYLDFTSDLGNGMGGAPNGTADWIDNLGVATTAAGVAAFTPAERASIETGIAAQLATIYGAYSVTWSTTLPGVGHERINFGAFSATPGALGVAPLQFMNLFASDGSEGTAARVFTNNFGFFIESGDPRATIISELTTGITGTAAHELGHALGVRHHHAYGDPGISPANYANTMDIQNTHIMATADTGIDETQRETPRTFSQWANLMLESAGGGNLALRGAGNTGTSLAATVLAESDSFTGGDVGDTAASAKALTLSLLPISGLEAANTVSSLTTGADVDYYKFDVTGPSSILADVWSDDLYINDFDPILTLFDTDGISILFSVDNTTYTGNFYNDGGTARTLDPALLNIVLPTAGTYFLRVGSVADITAPDGGNYNLVFGVASIPEARTWLTMGAISVGALGMCLLRHRSQPAVFAGAPVRDSRHSEPANSS